MKRKINLVVRLFAFAVIVWMLPMEAILSICYVYVSKVKNMGLQFCIKKQSFFSYVSFEFLQKKVYCIPETVSFFIIEQESNNNAYNFMSKL